MRQTGLCPGVPPIRSKSSGLIYTGTSSVNRAYLEFFRRTADELIGANFLNLIPASTRETVMANIRITWKK